ncbi:transcriptional regulator [Flavobacterium beibuense]|uniref:transcriptional regulator n=1 Tax=Flavobacterium beibuense TaxID=657326 RepID=UPI00101DB824|nr:transcriptional regulator [Flavobacterium beibuense]
MDNFNKAICSYITKNWIATAKSKRAFALDHGIDDKTVRRIADDADDYKITLESLNKICEARNIKLSEFFKLVGL